MTSIDKFLKFGFSLMLCTLLIACNNGQIESSGTLFPTSSEPSATPTRLPAIGILTPFPNYTIKQIAVNYVDTGDYSVFDMFFVQRLRGHRSRLVLYSDGQLILASHTYQQKIMTPSEMKEFLVQLRNLGFFSLYSNGSHDLTDTLYSFGSDYHPIDYESSYCVSVNEDDGKTLCAYKPFLKDLVPGMKNILQYLNDFHPEGLSVYHPDRILLWIQRGMYLDNDDTLQSALPWPETLPSLEGSDRKLLYVDGEGAQNVSELFGNTDATKVFVQNGVEYTVYMQVVLPHEELKNWFK